LKFSTGKAMLEIATVIVEILAGLADRVFMKVLARRILARWPNHEVIELFLPVDSSSFLVHRAERMKKIAQMQAGGWIYLRSERVESSKLAGNFASGETMYFLRPLAGSRQQVASQSQD
jgi:hypothetical protein